MDGIKDWVGRVWRRYRGLPVWAQVVIGVLVVSVIVGPFASGSDDDGAASDRTTTSAEVATAVEDETTTTTERRAVTTTTAEPTTTTDEPTTTTTEEVDPSRVSRDTFEEEWPLTVDAGFLRCLPGNAVIFLSEDRSTIYALNGLARGRMDAEGWRDIDEIWQDDPDLPGTKININPLVERGLELCED